MEHRFKTPCSLQGSGKIRLFGRDGGPASPLTHFTAESIASFAWTKDGKQIAIARGTLFQDAVLVKGFR